MNQMPEWALITAWLAGVITPAITLSIFIVEYRRNKKVLRKMQILEAHEQVMKLTHEMQFIIEKDKDFINLINSINLGDLILKDMILDLLSNFDYKHSSTYVSREASLVLNLIKKLGNHNELLEIIKTYWKDYNMSQHLIYLLKEKLLSINILELDKSMIENHKKSEKHLIEIIEYCSEKL